MSYAMAKGGKVTDPNYRDINERTGQQKDYIVLSEDEIAKGYTRSFRDSYIHIKCGVLTRMSHSIAATYARDPKFYGSTFCVGCKQHYPLAEFVWDGTTETVGS